MKNAAKLLMLLSLLFVCFFAYGQTTMEDIIYLKNGSIIRGIIIEQIPNQSIKIQTRDKKVFVFKYEEIEKMAKENSNVENNNSGYAFKNSDIKTNVSSSFKKSSSFFRKGVITIEMAYQFGSNLAGVGVNQLIDAENDYLIDLGMVETRTNSSGQIISSTPIDEYSYGTDFMVGGFRMLYFTSPKMSLGFHYYFIDYSQELTVLDQTEFGSLLSIYFFGPSINYFPYQKNKFGISMKGNIGLVSGTASSLPALYGLSSNGAFDDISGLSSSIINSRSTADISGVEANIGVAANWFICRWFSLDAGLSLYSYNGSLTNSIWAGTPTSFSVFKPVFTMGLNFHLFNKNK